MADIQNLINDDTPAVITKIDKPIGDDNYFTPFGVDDKNVQIYIQQFNEDGTPVVDENEKPVFEIWGSLRDFFAEWINFKNTWNDFVTNGHFLRCSTDTDSTILNNNPNIKLLFELNSDFDEDNITPTP